MLRHRVCLAHPTLRRVGTTHHSGSSPPRAQGRHDSHFDDRNGKLIAQLQAQLPGLCSMEMESFQHRPA